MKDLSDMPRAEGNTPDKKPWLAPLLAEAWQNTVDTGPKEMASAEARIRHSWAGGCARKVGYDVMGVEPTEPLTVADYWRFGTGTVIHERWQSVVAEAFPDAEVEKKVVIPEIPSAGHIDLFLPALNDEGPSVADALPSTAVELKSINGFGFKAAIGARGAAEGPRSSALLQGALNAKGANADELKIVYLALENLSPRELAKVGTEEFQRFAAEWTYTKDEGSPLAEQETSRMRKIVEWVDDKKLPPRSIPLDLPKGARITDPSKGAWVVATEEGIVSSGSTWACGYCSHRSRCLEDGAS